MAKNKVVLGAPAAGAAIALDKVQDEVFSTGMMGQGFGLEPIGDTSRWGDHDDRRI